MLRAELGHTRHVGYRSCFYRRVPTGQDRRGDALVFTESEKTFDPKQIYGDAPNPTILYNRAYSLPEIFPMTSPRANAPDPISTWYIDPDAEAGMADGHAPIWRHLIGLLLEHDLSTKTILDFGCNQGGFLRHLHALRPFRRALGVDIAQQSVARANELKGTLPVQYQTDVQLSGWDEQFDIAFSHEVIYLIEDIAHHAQTLWRALKPGGVYYAVTGCHTDNPLWPRWHQLVAERTNTVVQDRSITDYAETFRMAGFSVMARKLAFDGFLPYVPGGWTPDFRETLDYYTDTKIMFRLVKP